MKRSVLKTRRGRWGTLVLMSGVKTARLEAARVIETAQPAIEPISKTPLCFDCQEVGQCANPDLSNSVQVILLGCLEGMNELVDSENKARAYAYCCLQLQAVAEFAQEAATNVILDLAKQLTTPGIFESDDPSVKQVLAVFNQSSKQKGLYERQ